MEDICQQLIELIAQDPGNRQIPQLARVEPLVSALQALSRSQRVMLVSGFYIGRAQAWETDGPLGALILADALSRTGADVVILTDEGAIPVFDSGRRLLDIPIELIGLPAGRCPDTASLLDCYQPDILVAIERTGRGNDGRYYNASGYDVSAHVAHLDDLFVEAMERQITTVAVGDGGNELGFGTLIAEAQSLLGSASHIACATPCHHLIPCGVSNWGGYALAALYALQQGSSCLTEEQTLRSLLGAIVQAGAIDGVAGLPVETVDGLPLSIETGIFRDVMKAVEIFRGSRPQSAD